MINSVQCAHRSPLTAHRSPLTAHRSPLTAHPNFCLKFFGTLFKIIISGIFALVILTFLCTFYRKSVMEVNDPDGATLWRYTASSSYVYAVEGFSKGKLNNEGYVNLFDYEKGMSFDVLLMGASHMEAMQLMQQYNTANILAELSGEKIYNIGMSGHYLPTCANNLEAAVKKYNPLEFVVIESPHAAFADEDLIKALNHNITREDKARGKLRLALRENPYLFLLYLQANNVLKNYLPKESPFTSQSNPVLISEVLNKMSATVRENSSAKLIIAYHPRVSLNKDGSLKIEGDPEAVKVFADLCKENGIYFIDMGERFLSEYEKDFTLPYGFFNTSVALGHMNKDGHRMFAEEIYKLMQKIERGEN